MRLDNPMTPTILEELKGNRYKLLNHTKFPKESYLYKTESNWLLLIEGKRVTANNQRLGLIYSWRIRRELKKGKQDV